MSGFESEVLRCPEEVGFRQDMACLTKLMPELRSIGRHLVETGQNPGDRVDPNLVSPIVTTELLEWMRMLSETD